MRRMIVFWILRCVLGSVCAAQAAPTPGVSTISVWVVDSLNGGPLLGAEVSAVSVIDRTHLAARGVTDSLGRFELRGLGRGEYLVTFDHPLLDSLGIRAPIRRLAVVADTASVALAVPAAPTIQRTVCGAGQTIPDSAAVLIGETRDARTNHPVVSTQVTATWSLLAGSQRSWTVKNMFLQALTDSNGRFALCGLPRDAIVLVQANTPSDSTGIVPFRINESGVVHRILYVGQAPSPPGALSATNAPAGQRVVPAARFSGSVVSSKKQAIAGARVTLLGTDRVVASNSDGFFEFESAPLGTRGVAVRAIGYLPRTYVIDIRPTADKPYTFELDAARPILDTIRVFASRPDENGFLSRRHAGAGKFFDAADIAHIRPVWTSQLLRYAFQLRVLPDGPTSTRIAARGLAGFCNPSVFVDGRLYLDGRRITITDRAIDLAVQPNEIAGLEIYSASDTPPEFQVLQANDSRNPWCGAIVIWLRPPTASSRPH